MDVARVLREVRGHLEREGKPFALVGAFALNAYGLGRATADLDFLAPASAQAGVISFLESLGFRTLYRSAGFSNHLHPDPTYGRVDFVYVDELTAERLFAGARSDASLSPDAPVLVPKPEHLIAMKVQAIKNDPSRRLRDLADVSFLVKLPGVDLEQARRYFEAAGLRKDWDELLRS